MQSERWQQIQQLFDAALEIADATERVAYVRRQCSSDPELAREVLSLLGVHETAPEYLEDVALPRDELTGQVLGPWRVCERLGEGGMGVVYRGERADGTFEQQVAIKLVRRGLDTEHLLRRFASERRILATLDHPDIARPVDAGVAPDGRPYLVMDYVEGERIDLVCRGLALEERLELFVAVCDAVDHAHRRMVVHRDLKPANILVTRPGDSKGDADRRVKLLDFGVAKLLDPTDPGASSTLTEAQMRPLTPDYASPEQIRGEPVTTATDVYALGVLLYELLTGTRPFDRTGQPWSEMLREVDTLVPPRPSGAAAEGASALRGDLDAIVLTAMHSDPQRRYESPRALAEDLHRFRSGLPVRAREDSAVYRARRFVARHRWGVGVASAFVLLLALSSTLLAFQVERTARARDRSDRERARAEQVVELLIDLFRSSNPTIDPDGDTVTVAAFLERAGQEIEALQEQPDVQARAWQALAGIHAARSRYAVADSLLGRALERADEWGAEDPILRTTITHDRAKVWLQLGRRAEAAAVFRESLTFLRRQHGPYHRDVVIALIDLAWVVDDVSERRALLEESLIIASRVDDADKMLLAMALNALANEHFGSSDFRQAARHYAQAESLLALEVDDDHPHLMAVQHNLATSRTRLGDLIGAEALHRRLIEKRARVLGPRSAPVAGSWGSLGACLALQGRYEEAHEAFAAGAAIHEEIFGREHANVALDHINLGRTHELRGDFERALEDYAIAERSYDAATGGEGVARAWYVTMPVSALLATGRLDEARRRVDIGLEHCASQDEDPARSCVVVWLTAARVAMQEGDIASARIWFEKAYLRSEATLATDDPNLAIAACAYATTLVALGEREKARTLLDTHLPRLESWRLSDPLDLRRAREAHASLIEGGNLR